MRSPFGTYLARPSGQDSLTSDSGGMNCRLYFCGMVAESICCQMLWCHSLASELEAARTIKGEAIRVESAPLSVISSRISGRRFKQGGRGLQAKWATPPRVRQN